MSGGLRATREALEYTAYLPTRQYDAALAEVAAAEAGLEELRKIVREYDLWSEDANDGEFRLWDLDRLCNAIVAARDALFALDATGNDTP